MTCFTRYFARAVVARAREDALRVARHDGRDGVFVLFGAREHAPRRRGEPPREGDPAQDRAGGFRDGRADHRSRAGSPSLRRGRRAFPRPRGSRAHRAVHPVRGRHQLLLLARPRRRRARQGGEEALPPVRRHRAVPPELGAPGGGCQAEDFDGRSFRSLTRSRRFWRGATPGSGPLRPRRARRTGHGVRAHRCWFKTRAGTRPEMLGPVEVSRDGRSFVARNDQIAEDAPARTSALGCCARSVWV